MSNYVDQGRHDGVGSRLDVGAAPLSDMILILTPKGRVLCYACCSVSYIGGLTQVIKCSHECKPV
jgi:hypothetical protein